jgi:Zn-dependent protease with chaperone function
MSMVTPGATFNKERLIQLGAALVLVILTFSIHWGYMIWVHLLSILLAGVLVVGVIRGRIAASFLALLVTTIALWLVSRVVWQYHPLYSLAFLGCVVLSAVITRPSDEISKRGVQALESLLNKASSAATTYADGSALPAPLVGSGLYTLTFVIEIIGATARAAAVAFISIFLLAPVYLLFLMARQGSYTNYPQWGSAQIDYGAWLVETAAICIGFSIFLGLLAGFLPILQSLYHTLFPFSRSGSGPAEREALGAREPTRDEYQIIIDTLQSVLATGGAQVNSGVPSNWLVLDEPFPDSYTIGSTVYLSRAAIESKFLPGIIAHEMGHVAHKDGDLLLSLRRFVLSLAYWIGVDRSPLAAGAVLGIGTGPRVSHTRTDDEKLFFRFQALKIRLFVSFLFGGFGLLLLGRQWARFWQGRDFLADDFAVAINQQESLIDALEMYRHIDVAQPYLLSNRPYTAERLDRLKG